MSVCMCVYVWYHNSFFFLYDSYYELDFSSDSRAFASPSVQEVYP